MMIDLRRLRVLRAVGRLGTVTAAAEFLHLTPSAASHQIRQLGRELGVTLLEPDGRGVRLTQPARELLTHADAIAERWERAYTALHAIEEPAGSLVLCGIPTAVSGFVAAAVASLRDRHPDLHVHVREAEPVEGFDLLLTENADIAVCEATADTPPLADPGFEQWPLLRDPFDLLVSDDHPLARRGEVSLTDTANEPWVLEMPGASSRDSTLVACTAAGFRPNIAHEARQWSVVASLVAHRLGVALVPRLARLPDQLAVTRVPVRGDHVPTRLLLGAIRRGTGDHPAIAAILDALRTAAAGSGA